MTKTLNTQQLIGKVQGILLDADPRLRAGDIEWAIEEALAQVHYAVRGGRTVELNGIGTLCRDSDEIRYQPHSGLMEARP